MMIGPLPLSYCTNVHPGRSWDEVRRGLDQYTVPVQANYGRPLAAGLWLARPVVTEIRNAPDGTARLADELRSRGLTCYTLNAFPFGDFHSDRVKEQVYLPDWSQPARTAYTLDCAALLAGLLEPGRDGSISTVPLGFKGFAHPLDFLDRCCEQLVAVARGLQWIEETTGRTIRLAIEPEPFCVLETTPETLAFFQRLRDFADARGAGDVVRKYLGVCFDVCHQAVEFEDVADSLTRLVAAGVPIVKVHITCALQLTDPGRNLEGRAALARYVEPRYLHQTLAAGSAGARSVDLSALLTTQPPREYVETPAWRIHFHVPVHAERLGPLETTRPQLRSALAAVAALAETPHLEVETYTWEVLPDAPASAGPSRLIDGLTRELLATQDLLEQP